MKTPVVNTKSRVLVPGLPGHQAPVKATTQGSEKRKKDTDSKEVGGPTVLHHLQYNIVIQCDMNSQLGQVVWAKNLTL